MAPVLAFASITVSKIGNNVINDFDADQEDRVVFHTMFEGTLSAEIIGDDVKVSSSLGGSVLIKGLVTEMEGIDPTDPFFNSAMLMDFLLKPGIDGDGKGIITFEDKCVNTAPCVVDEMDVNCEVWEPRVPPCIIDLSDDHVGNTTIYTNEQIVADMYGEDDANVSVGGGQIVINLLGENI